jgi:hypothetical protein
MKYDQKAGIGILGGLALMGMSRWSDMAATTGTALILLLCLPSGVCLFCWGCSNYSVGKGYSKWLGFLGLLSCIGLLVLMILPDRRKEFDDHTP